MKVQPFISVIVPVYNEEKFLSALLENFKSQDYPSDRMEWIFIDGNSRDKTRQILTSFAESNSFVRVLDNPKRFVSWALNEAIDLAKGEIIIRMDAHSIYPKNYWSVLVAKLEEYAADNVGGMWITKPGANTAEAKAITLATSHPLGIGNASYRLGADRDIETDTVPYGCFRKSIFDRVGNFDTDLIRNQDDEFNARIKKSGGKIFMIPSVKIEYFARPDLGKLATMFYQYGLYKPLVNFKLGSPATLRQFAPPLLVLGFFLLGLLACLHHVAFTLFLILILTYGIPVLSVSLWISRKEKLETILFTMITFPVIHFSYGLGYIFGFIKFGILSQHKTN